MKKKPKNNELSAVSSSAGSSNQLSVEMVMAHPAFQDMSKRLESVQGMLQNLPVAIGQAVAEAMADAASKKSPEGSSGPAIPMAPRGEKDEIEIRKGQLRVGKEVYEVPKDGINRMKVRHIPGDPTKMNTGKFCHE